MKKLKRRTHFVMPDCQVQPGVCTDHIEAAGNYVAAKRPDVIVCGGDFFDMESLSSYDKNTAKGECKRYDDDIKAGKAAMKRFFKGIKKLNRQLAKDKKRQYKPELHFTLGNHEYRIQRYANQNPALVGKVSFKDLGLEEFGWKVYEFLEVCELDGILYSHFFPRNAKGKITQTKNGAPSAVLQLQRERQSCTGFHLQGMDYAIHQSHDKIQYGLMVGSFYMHEEDYLSPQGTKYWRGCIMKHEVESGQYDIMPLSLRYLLENWL